MKRLSLTRRFAIARLGGAVLALSWASFGVLGTAQTTTEIIPSEIASSEVSILRSQVTSPAISAAPALSGDYVRRPQPAPDQDFCISVLATLNNDSPISKFQFLRLVQEMSVQATPDFQNILDIYGPDRLDPSTPLLKIIGNVASPVLRQAAPEKVVASMNHIIKFNQRCALYIQGQVDSLLAFDPSLQNSDRVIREDSIYLRQLLSESLSRLGAEDNPTHSLVVQSYFTAIISGRDDLEFETYADNISEIERIYLGDLDEKLASSNDIVNEDTSEESLNEVIDAAEESMSDVKGPSIRIVIHN